MSDKDIDKDIIIDDKKVYHDKNIDKEKTSILKLKLDYVINEYNAPYKIKEILKTVSSVNKLTTDVCLFMRLKFLKDFYDNVDFSIFTKSYIDRFVKLSFKVLSQPSAGPKIKDDALFDNLTDFYKKEFQPINNYQLYDATHLDQILTYTRIDIVKNISNNIQLQFFNYLKQFINQSFKQEHSNILSKYSKKYEKTKNKKKSELKKLLKILKDDFINNTENSTGTYKTFLNKFKNEVLPQKLLNETYKEDIKENCFKYLKNMIKMNIELQKNEKKSFQFFPLRTSIIPKFIMIDTKVLIQLFIKENQNEYLKNINKYKHSIWSEFLNIDYHFFKRKFNFFNYIASTDGYSICLNYVNQKKKTQSEQKHKNFKNAKVENKTKTKAEIKTIKENKEKTKKEKDKKYKDEKKKKSPEDKKIKTMSEEDLKKIGEKIKELETEQLKEQTNKLTIMKNKNKIEKLKEIKKIMFEAIKIQEQEREEKQEFPYLTELSQKKIKEIKNKKMVYIDPGKRDLLYMIDNYDKVFTYSNKQRLHETKRLKYRKIIQKLKKEEEILQEEEKLRKINLKICDYKKFKETIKIKLQVNENLYKKYENIKFRQLKMYTYMNTKKSDEKLLKTVEKKYGKNIVIIIGDWSIGKQMRNFISTPNLYIKRLLKTKYEVYNIDEYLTSKTNYKTLEENKNLYLDVNLHKKKNPKQNEKINIKKMHSILTYKMVNGRKGCIHRDSNGVRNIRTIVKYFLETGKRKEEFERKKKELTEDLLEPVYGPKTYKASINQQQLVVKL